MRSFTGCASMIRVVGVAGAKVRRAANVNVATMPFQSAGSSTIAACRLVTYSRSASVMSVLWMANTVFKANYRRQRMQDVPGNPAARLGGYQVGFATYC
jgi:hypothetical protein